MSGETDNVVPIRPEPGAVERWLKLIQHDQGRAALILAIQELALANLVVATAAVATVAKTLAESGSQIHEGT